MSFLRFTQFERYKNPTYWEETNMKNKKVKISVVATAVALSMTTAVSVGAAVSAARKHRNT